MRDSTTLQLSGQGTLADLAKQINEEHHAAEGALNAGLQHALRAGQLLTQAKALCSHGEWQPWLHAQHEPICSWPNAGHRSKAKWQPLPF